LDAPDISGLEDDVYVPRAFYEGEATLFNLPVHNKLRNYAIVLVRVSHCVSQHPSLTELMFPCA